VVVTGGTGALGGAVVATLLDAGATVHVPCRDAGRPGALGRLRRPELNLVGGIDLADEAAVVRFYEALPALWASIHSAGGFAMAAIAETSKQDYEAMLSTNSGSCFLACREAVKAIRRTSPAAQPGKGRIVNVAAQAALDPRRGAGMVAYAAGKSAVAAITIALAEEVAKEGIWVNAVAPSTMDTQANRAAMPQADPSGWAKVEEVAGVIAFLASPQNLVARGGIVPVYGRS
jgi:NAD(P)-dependent dehydrogenase (short-subunit alcohol dehydrogenase family)